MTKYELYQILDENGFTPNDENVEILTEGLEDGTYVITEDGMLYENLGNRAARAQARIAMGKSWKSDEGTIEKYRTRVNAGRKGILGFGAKAAQKGYAKEAARKTKQIESTNKIRADAKKAEDQFAANLKKGVASVNAYKPKSSMKDVPEVIETKEKKDGDKVKGEVKGEVPALKETFFTDYELYQILDENGFETTTENLEILKEDLGVNTFIMDTTDLVLTEGISEDYIYMQLLDNCGFLVNESNIRVLKEAIENGHVLLTEDKTKKEPTKEELAKELEATKEKAAKNEKAADTMNKVKKALSTTGKILAITGAAVGTGIGAKALADKAEIGTKITDKHAENLTDRSTKAAEAANTEDAAKKAAVDKLKTSDVTDQDVKDAAAAIDKADKAKAKSEKLSDKANLNNNEYMKKANAKKINAAAGAALGATAGAGTALLVNKNKLGKKKEEKKEPVATE